MEDTVMTITKRLRCTLLASCLAFGGSLAAAWGARMTPAAPEAPSGVAAEDIGVGVARVTWSDNSIDEDGFEVQREEQKPRGTWFKTTLVAVVGADQTSVDDEAGTGTYRYRIRAFNGDGESAWSVWAVVTLAESGGDPVALTWTAAMPVVTVTWDAAESAAAAHVEQGYDDWRLPTIEELQAGIADGTIGTFPPNGGFALYSSKRRGHWIWVSHVNADENGVPIPEESGDSVRLPIASTYVGAKFVRP
jgi:hypothetical protein